MNRQLSQCDKYNSRAPSPLSETAHTLAGIISYAGPAAKLFPPCIVRIMKVRSFLNPRALYYAQIFRSDYLILSIRFSL